MTNKPAPVAPPPAPPTAPVAKPAARPNKPYSAEFRGPIIAGAVVLGLFVGGFGTWALTAPLSTGVTAPARLVVDTNRKSIQHLEGGIVQEILVREGAAVAAGQPLLQLDRTQVEATLKQLQGRLDAALAQQARLSAERAGRDAVTFPAELTARAAQPEVADVIAGQEQLFTARREALDSQIGVLENRIDKAKVQITGLERQSAAKQAQIDLMQKELNGKAELARKGYAPGVHVMEIERALARLEGEMGETAAQIAGVQQAMNEARLQILSHRTSFRENVETELRKTESDVLEFTERVAAVTAQHQRLTIVAPVAGTVVNMAAHTVGGVINPGNRILDVVPQNDDLVVEAQVSPAEIDDVVPGMSADVRFSAFNRGNIPLANGKVTMISADTLVNEITGAPYYRVRVQVDQESLDRLDGLQLIPGMPADVMINKGARTLFDYFFVPMEDMLRRSMR